MSDKSNLYRALLSLSDRREDMKTVPLSSLARMFANRDSRLPRVGSDKTSVSTLLGLSDQQKGAPPLRLSDLIDPSLLYKPLPPPPSSDYLARLIGSAPRPEPKRKVFISYHHKNDRWAYNYFSNLYGDIYELFHDQSVDGRIRSDDSEYVNRALREDYITGSSITIVLCGARTGKRKYVDWEIRSTLHCNHALLGLCLYSVTKTFDGKAIIPGRLHDNVVSGYAHFLSLSSISSAEQLKAAIEEAIRRSKNTAACRNDREKMGRNLS